MTVTDLIQHEDDSIRSKLEVTKPDEFEYINLFMYGESGVGKTYFLGTAEDCDATFPFLILDCEGGTKTLRKRKNIDVKHVRTPQDLMRTHDELFFHNKGWYQGVALDNLSDIQDIDIRAIMDWTKANAKNPDTIDIDVPSPREYGKSRTHMRKVVRAFKDLPMHTFITALDQEVPERGDTKNEKPPKIRPNLTGKVQGDIPSFMDIVGHYRKEADGTRVLQLLGTKKVIAKTRFPELGDLMRDPTIPQIWEVLSGTTKS